MSSVEPKTPKRSLRQVKRRPRVNLACQWCRTQKRKCDGVRPACGNCQKKESLRAKCDYSRGLASESNENSYAQYTETPVGKEPTKNTDFDDESKDQTAPSSNGGQVLFAKEINAAVNSRLGTAGLGRPNPHSNLFPMVDAPLFGTLDHLHVVDSSSAHSCNVLPPRRQADELLELYWSQIQPIDPVIDQERFCVAYRALFSGDEMPRGYEENVFAATLNAVFALATNLQVAMSFEQREKMGDTYFRRAWALLRPDTLMWEVGSVEIVQCMCIMGRFLHCTDNLHFNWMLIGAAIRMAQGLGLHMAGLSPSDLMSPDVRWRKRVWEVCIFHDRQNSNFLGRIPSVAPTASSLEYKAGKSVAETNNNQKGGGDRQLEDSTSVYWEKSFGVVELGCHILLSQMSTNQTFSEKHDLIRACSKGCALDTINRFSGSLRQHENGLPSLRKWEGMERGEAVAKDPTYRQTFMLHLRLLHVRILLFRHVLWYMCLPASSSSASSFDDMPAAATAPTAPMSDSNSNGNSSSTIEYAVTKNYAQLCVESAQRIITLVYGHNTPGTSCDVVPWWAQFTYLYIAMTILVAAMLRRADLYTPAAAVAWDQAMAVLAAQQDLSPFVRQSRAAFQTLSRKILNSSSGPNAGGGGGGGGGGTGVGGGIGTNSNSNNNNNNVDAGQGFPSSSSLRVGQPQPPPLSQQDHNLQDLENTFPDIRVDFDNCFFGMDDISWLVNLDIPSI